MFDSSVETSTTSAQRIRSTSNKPHLVTQATIKIRSMGTGTHLDLGGGNSQEYRLTAIGQSLDIEVMPNHACKPYFDLNDIYQKGDTADITYEIIWENHEESKPST